MKALCPRHKRLKREGRLQAAKHWLPKYIGKNLVNDYSKHFGVNKVCAALKLRILGYEISTDYIEQLKADAIRRQQLKERNKHMKELQRQDDMLSYSDETFCFIAGYTSNGVPYGLAWEESENDSVGSDDCYDDEDLPFC